MTRFAYPPHQHMQSGAETQTHTVAIKILIIQLNYTRRRCSRVQSSEFGEMRNDWRLIKLTPPQLHEQECEKWGVAECGVLMKSFRAQGQCIRTAKSYKNHVYLICITKDRCPSRRSLNSLRRPARPRFKKQ